MSRLAGLLLLALSCSTPGCGYHTAGHVVTPDCKTIHCAKGYTCETHSTCPPNARCIWAGNIAECVKTDHPEPKHPCKTLTCPHDKPHYVERNGRNQCVAGEILNAPSCLTLTCAHGFECVMESNCPHGAECFANIQVAKCVAVKKH